MNCSTLWLLVQDNEASRDQYARANACLDRFSRDPLDERWQLELDEASQQLNIAASGLVRAVDGDSGTPTAARTGGLHAGQSLEFSPSHRLAG